MPIRIAELVRRQFPFLNGVTMRQIGLYNLLANEPLIAANNRPTAQQSNRFQAILNQKLPSADLAATWHTSHTPAAFFIADRKDNISKSMSDSVGQNQNSGSYAKHSSHGSSDGMSLDMAVEMYAVYVRLPQLFDADRPGLDAPTMVPKEVNISLTDPKGIKIVLGPLEGKN